MWLSLNLEDFRLRFLLVWAEKQFQVLWFPFWTLWGILLLQWRYQHQLECKRQEFLRLRNGIFQQEFPWLGLIINKNLKKLVGRIQAQVLQINIVFQVLCSHQHMSKSFFWSVLASIKVPNQNHRLLFSFKNVESGKMFTTIVWDKSKIFYSLLTDSFNEVLRNSTYTKSTWKDCLSIFNITKSFINRIADFVEGRNSTSACEMQGWSLFDELRNFEHVLNKNWYYSIY